MAPRQLHVRGADKDRFCALTHEMFARNDSATLLFIAALGHSRRRDQKSKSSYHTRNNPSIHCRGLLSLPEMFVAGFCLYSIARQQKSQTAALTDISGACA
jgi:hypothetical protein